MSSPAPLDSARSELIPMPPGGLISGQCVGVSRRWIGAPRSGGLFVLPGDLERMEPVWLVPLDEVPEGCVAIGENLAARLGLRASVTPWRLEVLGFEPIGAGALTLEVTAESGISDIAQEIGRSGELVGRLVWVRQAIELESSYLEIAGRPYRIRQLQPAAPAGSGLYRINEATRIELFSPSAKVGVDVVVLADTSGSMSVTDLSDEGADPEFKPSWLQRLTGAKAPVRRISRISALRKALRQLLDARLQASGVSARWALVGFDAECRVLFPRGGGMAGLSRDTARESADEFGQAIELLSAKGPTTEIAKALHFAAELLHRHGRPGNERLIVLLSDGADWAPKSDDQRGEVVAAIEDPLSMMEHLSERLDIRLHAIGISTEPLYRAWLKESGRAPQANLTPNHLLLERLVEVSGGDPSRTGDLDVLSDYLRGLGSGVTSVVRPSGTAPRTALSNAELELLGHEARKRQRHAEVERTRVERGRAHDAVISLLARCNAASLDITGQEPFRLDSLPLLRLFEALGSEARDRSSFTAFILNLWSGGIETIDRSITGKRFGATGEPIPEEMLYPIAAVRELLWKSRVRQDLELIRNYFAHNPQAHADPVRRTQDFAELVSRYVGKTHLAEDDAAAWSAWQLRLLADFTEILERTYQVLCATPPLPVEQRRRAMRRAPARAAPAPAPPQAAEVQWKLVGEQAL